MKKLNGALVGLSLLAMATAAFSGCSAGGESASNSFEDTKSVSEEIGFSCGTKEASTQVNGGFAKAYVSEASYNDCYRGKIVEILNYDAKYVTGGYTKVSWGDTVPSDADCTSTTVGAYLLRYVNHWDGTAEWVPVVSKGAHGDLPLDNEPGDISGPPAQPRRPITGPVTTVPKDPGIFGPPITTKPKCHPPEVYFYGDEMPFGSYKIVASARSPGAVLLHPVKFETVAGTCGQKAGDLCCYDGDPCSRSLNCNTTSKKCESCGTLGGTCCAVNDLSPTECPTSQAVCGGNGKCNACGGPGQPCCESASSTGGRGAFDYCDGTAKCIKNKCSATPAPPPCGGKDQACCDTAKRAACDGSLYCDFWQAECKLPWGGGASCFAEGQACTGSQSCCTGTTCDPASLKCKRNPNTSSTHDATSCDEPGDHCCLDLPQTNLGGCDPVFHKSLHCGTDAYCKP